MEAAVRTASSSIPMCSIRLRQYARTDLTVFHIVNARFWEAVLLPIVVVVLIAFSSCMDVFLGQCVSLAWWYAANFYMMAYALQVLHPQVPGHILNSVGPFAGLCSMWIWSFAISALEMVVYHVVGAPRLAYALGITLYGLCGCLLLHAVIGPWGCWPKQWRPAKVWRYWNENGILKKKKRDSGSKRGQQDSSDVDLTMQSPVTKNAWAGSSGSQGLSEVHVGSRWPKVGSRDLSSQKNHCSCAGHVSFITVGYALFVGWWCAVLSEGELELGPLKQPYEQASRTLEQPRQALGRLAAKGSLLAKTTVGKTINITARLRAIERGSASKRPTQRPGSRTLPVDPFVSKLANMSSSSSSSNHHRWSEAHKDRMEKLIRGAHGMGEHYSWRESTRAPHEAALPSADGSVNATGSSILASNISSTGQSAVHSEHRRPSDHRTHHHVAQVAPPQKRPKAVESEKASSILQSRGKSEPQAAIWCEVLILGSLVIVGLWIVDHGKTFEFSMPYLIYYNVVLIRVPDILGHVVLSSFGSAHLYMPPAIATTVISLGYMTGMQVYIVVLQWVCRRMSAQHLFPRFHFIAQMYYYLFWYMMLMVVSPSGIEEIGFWLMVAYLNGSYLLSNAGAFQQVMWALWCRVPPGEPPLKILFDSKLAVQDQLADVVSLLMVPAVATSFHVCSYFHTAGMPLASLGSLWLRFGALLIARLASGLLTEEIFRRRVEILHKADTMELQLLPLDSSTHRLRYLNDVCVGPNLALESTRNVERCALYFTSVAVVCAFATFQRGDVPSRYAFVAFG